MRVPQAVKCGLRDTAFHGVFSLPLFGGLSYNAIYDKNYAKQGKLHAES